MLMLVGDEHRLFRREQGFVDVVDAEDFLHEIPEVITFGEGG